RPRRAPPPRRLGGSRARLGSHPAARRPPLPAAPAVPDHAMDGYPERLLLGCLSGVSIVATTRMRPPHGGRPTRLLQTCGAAAPAMTRSAAREAADRPRPGR